MIKNRIKIESKDTDGKKVTVYVTRPTREENSKAQMLASKVFREAISSGALVRVALEKLLIDQGIWSEEKQQQVDKIDKEIVEKLTKLKGGGIKLSNAKQLAIDIRLLRLRKNGIMAERNSHDEYTAEAQSDNAKFDYLASVCIKNEKGEPFFNSIEEYRANGEQPFVFQAASKLAGMLYGIDDNWEANLPENKFLKEYEFINEDLRLVDGEGRYVTTDGRLIDDNFRYIDEDGNFVDYDGNPVDEDGLPLIESKPFLDDQGNPIVKDKPKRRTKKTE